MGDIDPALPSPALTSPVLASPVLASPVLASPVLRLPDVLDLRAAGPLSAELFALSGSNVEVDASHVHKLGGQCLQVLLSARACWQGAGLRFRVIGPSQGFTESLALLGATSRLPTNEA